jgi:hypothetical protein
MTSATDDDQVLGPKTALAVQLLGLVLRECLSQCNDEEAMRLKYSMDTQFMSDEVKELFVESVNTILLVADQNAMGLANRIVLGEDYSGFRVDDFAEEEE